MKKRSLNTVSIILVLILFLRIISLELSVIAYVLRVLIGIIIVIRVHALKKK